MIGSITNNAAAGADNCLLESRRRRFGPNRERALRGQALFDVQTRNNCAELVVQGDFEQTIALPLRTRPAWNDRCRR
jgi:hypothetical protein